MATDKIQQALKLLQETIAARPDITLHLDLTRREAEVLRAVCLSNVSVPEVVVEGRPTFFGKRKSTALDEVSDLLGKIKQKLTS